MTYSVVVRGVLNTIPILGARNEISFLVSISFDVCSQVRFDTPNPWPPIIFTIADGALPTEY